MTAITFDTLKFTKRLREAGIPEKQAEAEAEALTEALESSGLELATKHDIKDLKSEIEIRFEKTHSELTLIKWMLGILLAGVISLILKSFF